MDRPALHPAARRASLLAAILGMLLATFPVHAEEPARAILRDGRRLDGLVRAEGGRGVLVFGEGVIPLQSCRRIDLPPAVLIPATRPLRRMALRGGDNLDAELLHLRDGTARVAFAGADPFDIPLAAIDSIGPLPGEREELFEGFETGPESWTVARGSLVIGTAAAPGPGEGKSLDLTAPVRLRLPAMRPARSARIAFRYSTGAMATGQDEPRASRTQTNPKKEADFRGSWGIAFHVKRSEADPKAGPEETRVTVTFDAGSSLPRVETTPLMRVDHQPLAEETGWRAVSVTVRHRQIQVLVDGQLRARGELPDGTIGGVELFSGLDDAGRADGAGSVPSRERPSAAVFLDDLQIQSAVVVASPRREWRQDGLLLDGGDELLGELRSANDHGVTFEAGGHAIEVPWRDVARVTLKRQPASPECVEGCVARLVLASPVDRPALATENVNENTSCNLLGTLVAADHKTLTLHHPLIGSLKIPKGAVNRIEPKYEGGLLLIDPDVHHLGNAVREQFRHPAPEGTRHEMAFDFDLKVRNRSAFLSAIVRDMEPSGPMTPPGSPFLRELKAGGLRTEVDLNGTSLGDLNSRLTWKRGTATGQNVEMPVAAEFLRKGRNTLNLVLSPSRKDPSLYDESEVGPIWLELRSEQTATSP